MRIAQSGFRCIHRQGNAVRNADCEPIRISGFTTDLAERRRAEEALERERDPREQSSDDMPNRVFFGNTESHFKRVEQADSARARGGQSK